MEPKKAKPSPSPRPRAWVGVVSRSHVRRGVAGGFAQLNHGKRAPLERMNVGDWLVYYSPRTDFSDGEPLRAFTAIGRIVGERVYTFDMGGGFVPYRRDVQYVKRARGFRRRSDVEIHREQPQLGMLARRGHFEIEMADLEQIAIAMGAGKTRP